MQKKWKYALATASSALAVSMWVIGCTNQPNASAPFEVSRGTGEAGAPAGGGTAGVPGVGPEAGGGGRGVIAEPGGGNAVTPALAGVDPARFNRGLFLFTATWKKQLNRPDGLGGLGPIFNANKCIACHGGGGAGGISGSPTVERMAVLYADSSLTDAQGFSSLTGTDPSTGQHNPAFDIGGPLCQLNTVGDGFALEHLPTAADVAAMGAGDGSGYKVITSHRAGPIVAGSGLLSAIPNGQIEGMAAWEMANGASLGIHGRPAMLSGIANDDQNVDGTIGHLGWKGMVPDNYVFTADADDQEVGLTNPHGHTEMRPNAPGVHVTQTDLTPEQFDSIAFFCNALSPVQPVNTTSSAYLAGRAAFAKAGCAYCHVAPGVTTGSQPTYSTAQSASQLDPNTMSRIGDDTFLFGSQPVAAYSDLLLHHMGTGLADGFLMGAAGGDEWKTQTLWGLRFKSTYLHDKRAGNLDAAIRAHSSPGSEANTVVANYMGTGPTPLSAAERNSLLTFLKDL